MFVQPLEDGGLTSTVGKLYYLPPELYVRKPAYDGYLADVWSAGICLFFMLAGGPRGGVQLQQLYAHLGLAVGKDDWFPSCL